MTDQLERLLRDRFAQDAEQAPDPSCLVPGRLAAAGRAAARHRRRRHAMLAAVALAALVVVPVCLIARAGDDSGAAPAGRGPAPATVTTQVPDGVLSFRGVQVPVPSAMLAESSRHCGASLSDAAWVTGAEGPTLSCSVTGDASRLTEVELRVDPSAGDSLEQGTRQELPDGRVRFTRTFADRGVRLVVTSPDAVRALALLGSAQAIPPEGQIDGCRVVAPQEPGAADAARRTGPLVPFEPIGGVVCGYLDGWLTRSRTLTADGAADLAGAISPGFIDDAMRDCKRQDPDLFDGGFWQLRFEPDGGEPAVLTVRPRSCVDGPAGVAATGQRFEMTKHLAERLGELVAGPTHW